MFDKDGGGGVIDHEERRDVVLGLFTMVEIRIHEDILVDRLEEMLDAIHIDGDGEIEKEEFIKNAMNCHFICDIVNGDVVMASASYKHTCLILERRKENI